MCFISGFKTYYLADFKYFLYCFKLKDCLNKECKIIRVFHLRFYLYNIENLLKYLLLQIAISRSPNIYILF